MRGRYPAFEQRASRLIQRVGSRSLPASDNVERGRATMQRDMKLDNACSGEAYCKTLRSLLPSETTGDACNDPHPSVDHHQYYHSVMFLPVAVVVFS